jgi:hypothetical protein
MEETFHSKENQQRIWVVTHIEDKIDFISKIHKRHCMMIKGSIHQEDKQL